MSHADADLASCILQQCSGMQPDQVFLSSPAGQLTWGGLRGAIGAAMTLFDEQGLTTGDRVILDLRDDSRAIPLLMACLVRGMGVAIADPDASEVHIRGMIDVMSPAAIWTDREAGRGLATSILPVADVLPLRQDGRILDPETIGLIVFTSGTLSRPKAVMLSHRAIKAQLDVFGRVYGFGPGMRLANPLPLHHVDGLIRGAIAAAAHGGTLYRPGHLSVQALPRWLMDMDRDRITHMVAVPAILSLIERVVPRAAPPPSALRLVISSADTLGPVLWTAAEARFNVPVANAWGQSECVCDALFSVPGAGTDRSGLIGRPEGCEARVVSEDGDALPDGAAGELEIRGPLVMSGYLGDPEATAQVMHEGWLRTGDKARRDPDGNYRFEGRLRSVIVSGGVSVHPEAVTAAALELEGVAEAATIGVPDPDWGERVALAVVAAQGAELDQTALFAAIRARLAPEMHPHFLFVLEALPRGGAGKVRREALLDMIRIAKDSAAAFPEGRLSVLSVAARTFGVNEDGLSEASTPFNTPAWDSLMHIALVEALEEAFAIKMTPEDIVLLSSLGDASAIVARHLSLRAPSSGGYPLGVRATANATGGAH